MRIVYEKRLDVIESRRENRDKKYIKIETVNHIITRRSHMQEQFDQQLNMFELRAPLVSL